MYTTVNIPGLLLTSGQVLPGLLLTSGQVLPGHGGRSTRAWWSTRGIPQGVPRWVYTSPIYLPTMLLGTPRTSLLIHYEQAGYTPRRGVPQRGSGLNPEINMGITAGRASQDLKSVEERGPLCAELFRSSCEINTDDRITTG